MNRKKLKTIQNIAAQSTTRASAKANFGDRQDFKKLPGAWIHVPTATLFVV